MPDKTFETFEPITAQAEFDDRKKALLAREREKREKESVTRTCRSSSPPRMRR